MNSKSNSDQESHTGRTYSECGYNESVDEAFATLQETQIELSHMADSKANIMITVCSILLTLVVAQLQSGSLLIPSAIFALFSAIALLFAILCVMPSAHASKLDPADAEIPKSHNLMFFMNFAEVPVDRFVTELERIMTNPQSLYENLSRDVYFAGKVLAHKKYRYLRWSYINLMLGIGIGAIALAIDLMRSF